MFTVCVFVSGVELKCVYGSSMLMHSETLDRHGKPHATAI
jgi:hypothetical protein